MKALQIRSITAHTWLVGWQGNDPDVQETPVVQGARERVAGVDVAPHAVLWAGKSCKMSSAVKKCIMLPLL